MVAADGMRVDHNRALLRRIPSDRYLALLEGVALRLALRIVEDLHDHIVIIIIHVKSYLFEVNELLDYVTTQAAHPSTQPLVALVELGERLREVFGQNGA